MAIELAGQRILVVGASSGIGAAIARAAAQAGAHVAATARRVDRLDALASSCTGVVALPADVTDEPAIRSAVDSAAHSLGGLDAVIFAAATSPLLPMARASQADWRAVLDTNLVGAALVAAAAAPHLIRRGGRLVILSSKSVQQPFADLGLYATSKAALEGLVRCLPVEFPGLLVTRVVIGNTHGTDFASSWDGAALHDAMERWAAAGTLGATSTMHPEEVADAVLQVLTSSVHIGDLAVLDSPALVAEPAEGGE
ncbi:MAG: SDR family oxidoreductase [Microthrixaceae bacterium]